MTDQHRDGTHPSMRIGAAAEALGVSPETIRRWEADGRITAVRSAGGQRRVLLADVARLREERRQAERGGEGTVRSVRNRFQGVVVRVEIDRVAAVVEVLAGPHRLVSLMTAEAAQELDLHIGDDVVCTVKATNVGVERPRP